MDQAPLPARLARMAFVRPGLRLLVLHGSGARGERHELSDWDFAFSGSADLDVEGLRLDLVTALGTDDVDLADLSTAGGLLRYRVARDGRPLYEERPGLFDRFRIEATLFWCDIEPVVRRSHDRILKSLEQ